MEFDINFRGNRERATENRGKREYFAIIFKNMAHLSYMVSFMRFFCSDFADHVLKDPFFLSIQMNK